MFIRVTFGLSSSPETTVTLIYVFINCILTIIIIVSVLLDSLENYLSVQANG